ncbi:MAG: ATP-binding cassette domain-containing protein, partial [Rhodothermales bacterium]
MPSLAVDVDNLTHRYGERTALDEVDLSVHEGALFGVLGPNGGGKTTLFRILSTLIRPTKGTATVFGVDVRDRPDAIRKRIGIVFQSVALDAELTVRENLRTHAALYGVSRRGLDERLDVLLPQFGLVDRVDERVSMLSGGLKRRVDLVRGLLHAPPLLLLDEPTTGLDPAARHSFWETVDRV